LLAQREDIDRERAETMPRLQSARDEEQRKEQKAHEDLQATTRERVNADQARLSASLDFSFKLSTVEAEIKKASPREIAEFIYEMLKADEVARLEYNIEQRPGRKSRIIGQVTSTVFNSNKKAVDAKRAYLKTAIAEAENMKLQAIPHNQIVARLQELKTGIPESFRFETVDLPLPDTSELRRVSWKPRRIAISSSKNLSRSKKSIRFISRALTISRLIREARKPIICSPMRCKRAAAWL
jgi:hypothetical protein